MSFFASALPEDKRRGRREGRRTENPWHDNSNLHYRNDTTRDNEAIVDDSSGHSDHFEGTWGEQDAGIESCQRAMTDYEALRKELSDLQKTRSLDRSKSAPKRERSAFRRLSRTATRRSERRPSIERATTEGTEKDLEQGQKDSSQEDDDFELEGFMRQGHFEKRVEGVSQKKLGVIWRNLTVKGVGATATTVKTLPDAIMNTFGPDLYHIITRFIPQFSFKRHQQTRDLVHDFSGVVRDGEMMLVLGRPGSGCSTFLKAIANKREDYAAVEGEVSYGGIPAAEQKKFFRGEVVYNPEDDQHFASLNVWQTLYFSLLNKTKKSDKGEISVIINALLSMFGIKHTKYTLVGDEYVRGVSGGERKRISIAETLASKSTVVTWDNSTRGLDSSTALDYTRSLRIMTDVSQRTTFVTLYQAGQEIYELMDKVMVIESGRCIFEGPISEAKQYFIDLGFECPERQTTPDFLTSVGDPAARRFREGYEDRCPRTADELESAFRKSEHYKRLGLEIDEYQRDIEKSDFADARNFKDTTKDQKSKYVRDKSNYTISFWRQVLACTRREFWLIWGDKPTLVTKFFIIIANGLIVGSLFYGESLNTSGAFSRGGALFFSILFLGWLQLSELMKAVSGRVVVARHHDYAFYRPSAVAIARVVTDFPMLWTQATVFAIILYFMADLDVNVSKFFIYYLIVYTTTFCITAMYRMFAAMSPTIDDAVRFSGLALNLLIVFVGYVIPKPQLVSDYIWFGWLTYVNPIAYAFEAVMANEFSGRIMECAPSQLVPQGPGAVAGFQGCSLPGSGVNAVTVSGDQYLESNYTYTRAHLWRNFGVIIAFTVLYILVTVIVTEYFDFSSSGGGSLVFKKSRKAKKEMKAQAAADMASDPEKGKDLEAPSSGSSSSEGVPATRQKTEEEALGSLAKSDAIFSWKDIEYTVPYQGGERKLLNKVSGYVKPGQMIALVGSSGAGKTTLLNTLAQRQKFGKVSGEFLVDGKPLDIAFQRGTGFCEQQDIHDMTATVREALEFSAILRQDREISHADKIAYVDNILDLLELREIQDAILSSLGVEQRKRVTIGVELAAKPQLLLFLDEPTSGLDSNSAFSIVRFIRKLADAGQSIICTIHQPSSILIQQFDQILALNPGGNVFYSGPVGKTGEKVVEYFSEHGVDCPPEKNVAEFILETAAKKPKRADGTRINWNEEWKNSENAKNVYADIEKIKTDRANKPRSEDPGANREFAAPVWTQTYELTRRIFVQYWRDPSYIYGKLFIAVLFGILNGFTFWQLGNSVQDLQDRLFSVFLIIIFPAVVVNGVVPKFYQNMALWQARELPSRTYGWFPFVTAMVVGEIPAAIVSATIYFVLWYFAAGLPPQAPAAGYVFLMTMLFFLFQASWGQWIAAFAPSFTVISNVLPFFFVVFALMNGVVRPYDQMPAPWRYFLYYAMPSTYWIGGCLAATLTGLPVECTINETAQFNTPNGETCADYAGGFAQSAGGYLLNPTATADCQYCPYSVADQYLATINVQPSDKWPYFGIFLAFVISNYALVYFFIWSVRIKGWTFGMGPLFAGIGKVLSKLKGSIFGKKKDGEPAED